MNELQTNVNNCLTRQDTCCNNFYNAACDFVHDTTVDAVAACAAYVIVAPYLPCERFAEITILLGTYAVYDCAPWNGMEAAIKNTLSGEITEKTIALIQYVKGYIFTGYLSATVGTLIHELGHKACASLVFRGTTRIFLLPPLGGTNFINNDDPYGVGHLLGAAKSELLWTLGGPIADAAITVAGIAYHHFKNQESPKTAKAALMFSVNTIFKSIPYVLSALEKKDLSMHDYAFISAATGISPIAMALYWLALPVITKVALQHLYPHTESTGG